MTENEYAIMKNKAGVLIHASVLEDAAKAQIEQMSGHPSFDRLIAIMPDVHLGKGSVIGFTGRFKNSVIPATVGVDIGCGVMTYALETKDIDFPEFDKKVRENIPLGFNSRTSSQEIQKMFSAEEADDALNCCKEAGNFLFDKNIGNNFLKPYLQMGTLGSGNHFLEIEKYNGKLFLTVHSGSRNFGLKVANYYQSKAKALMKEINLKVPQNMEYLPMSNGGSEYITMMKVAQLYAHYNRLAMIKVMLTILGEKFDATRLIESVHNYISDKDGIVRKGAISAHKNEKVVIPLNMGDGIILGTGKGNANYNFSAPHGAGRVMGRKAIFRLLDKDKSCLMDKYRKAMDGVFSTSVCEKTFDESPFAYKSYDSLMPYLEETIDIECIAKPVYNLKSVS